MSDNIHEFRQAMKSVGLEPPENIVPGKMHRFPGSRKRNINTAGWCQLFPDMQGGVYGDWSTGLSETWQAEHAKPMTEVEKSAYREKIKKARAQVQKEREQAQSAAAAEANERWLAAEPASIDHPYLSCKSIQVHGLREEGNSLLVPLHDDSGKIWAVQTISADGSKLFLPKGCRTKGLYFGVGPSEPEGQVLIVEGFATGATVHEATGLSVYVAFNAGNLLPVAECVRQKYPDLKIVFCADDDHRTKGNPGITMAREAAAAVGGFLAIPDFGTDRPEDATDFNDLASLRGKEAVCGCIESATKSKQEEKSGEYERETVEAAITRLAQISEVEYEQSRKEEAKALQMRTTVLDKLVKAEREVLPSDTLPFKEVEPYGDQVDPAILLSEIKGTATRFIVCNDEIATAVSLWVAMTWFMDVVQVAPLAVITAPEKRCGKTQLLTLLGKLSHRSITASNISPAALYRAIDAWKPTLLIDEADACMKDNEELRGIINSGHTRDSAYVIRTVGDNFTPTMFSTWGAKAISGIGHIAGTLMDRAVVLELRRKLPHENVDRLRYAEADLFPTLAAKLARFATDYQEQIREARPFLPESLNDRQQDNWEPLLAIASVVSPEWFEMATSAALKISGAESITQSIGTELLADIKELFEYKQVDRISLADLVVALTEDEEKTWATYNRGKPIRTRQVSKKLKEYRIVSKTVRVGGSTAKGFERSQFAEAFTRYLSPPPGNSVTQSQINDNNRLSVTERNVSSRPVTKREVGNYTKSNDCYDVTEQPALRESVDKKIEVRI